MFPYDNNSSHRLQVTAVQQETSTETAKVGKANEGYTRYIYVSDGGKKRDRYLAGKQGSKNGYQRKKTGSTIEQFKFPEEKTPQKY